MAINTDSTTDVETLSAVDDSAGVTLQNVRKEYGDIVAVNDLSLEIRAGEFLVLLGPSGCGKSTTLRMVAGLETPTTGTIEIGDVDVTQTLPQERDLSMVFQSYALYPHKTVRGNLAFPLGKMDVTESEKERKIEQTAELLEIAELLDKKPGQLSGGQRQRVAVGRTIIREPKAFLMDEPLSNLDAKLRVKTRFEIRELQQELGTTTIYVTHDQEEAMSVADRIAVMNDGALQQVGSPQEIYKRPTNRFVAEFIGEPSMNFFDVTQNDEPVLFSGADPLPLGEAVPPETTTLGVRPEDVALVEPTQGVETTDQHLTESFECEVEVVEPLGNAYELGLTVEDDEFTVRLRDRPEAVTEGSTVQAALDTSELHAFDEHGEAIR